MLKLENIFKIYKTKNNNVTALENINLEFNNNGLVFILGTSGSGKSTLLNIIGGLDDFDSGNIYIQNKNIKEIKNLDNYRNNFIGFIFQDFNLIDDYTIYDNIVLPLKLQNEKINEKEIDDLLKKIGIDNLKLRKINELSGGERQRVAIARAILKNPFIILADEPTGNLDTKNGTYVMDLLKKISKDTLVIVVTHNIEFANKYGDRIIEIKDGTIISDTKSKNENIEKKYVLKENHLPLKEILRFGIKYIKSKKIRFVLSMILLTISSIFLSLMFKIETYDVNSNHLKIIKENNLNFIEIKKYTYSESVPSENKYTDLKMSTKLTEDDASNILSEINGYKIYELGEYTNIVDLLNINIYIQKDFFNDKPEEKTNDYTIYTFKPQIIEGNNINEKIIGNYPNKENEILISNYIADLIIEYGITYNDTIYYPKNYNDLFNKEFNFGNSKVLISGIIDYDLSKYEPLKETFNDENTDYKLYYQLLKNAENIYNKIYVKEGFIDYIKQNLDKYLDIYNNCFSMEINENNNIASYSGIYVLDDEITYFDGEKIITTNKLNTNEMLIDLNKYIDMEEYKQKLNKYISNNSGNKLELEIEFLKNNYNIKEIINQTYDLKIYKDCKILYQTFNRNYDEIYEDINVIGLTGLVYLNSEGIYFSNELLNDYIDYNVDLVGILTYDIEESIKQYPFDYIYAPYSIYSNDIEIYYSSILSYRDVINIISIILSIGSIILIFNFTINNIFTQKKEIGILKSLGTKNFDIMKIFIAEGMIMVIATTLFSSIGSKIIFNVMNNGIIEDSLKLAAPFIFDLKTVIIINLYNLIITLIACIIPFIKIYKMKPIDVINK